MRWSPAPSSLAVALALLGGADACRAQSDPATRFSVPPGRVDTPPQIDGVLDDEAWADAPMIDGFTQIDPVLGAAPTERTEVRLLYDADNLYVAVTCLDSEPDRVIARSMGRDDGFASDDRVGITLDTFHDRRNGYFFVVSAAGGKRDGIIEGTRTRWEWDGLWTAKTRRDERGWTIEIAFPMKTFSFTEDGPTWGFNVERIISRKNELVRWASPTRDTGLATMAVAGEITDLEGLEQGRGVTIKPFFTGKLATEGARVDFEPGLDIFYRINPSTTAAVTINTDFAEAEVDDRRVNLTRFPLFFPEKRDFFLEDAGIFEFGGINSSPRPFHSRRIGIVRGEQKDILAGLRLTGRSGALRFGVLDVQMQDDDELGQKNLGVLRLTHDVLDESSVGVILTNGSPGARGGNQLVGADFNYVNSDALGGRVSASLWAMATRDDPADGPGQNDSPYAFGGRFNWNADPWSFFVFADEVGQDFSPDLGFVSRPGTREYVSRASHTWRPADAWVRSVSLAVGGDAFTTLGSDIQSASLDLPTLTLTNHTDDSLSVGATFDREALDEPFEIVDGVVIPTDTYDNAGWSLGLRTAESRWLSVEAEHGRRGFYDGDRTDTSLALLLRPNASLALAAEYEINDIELESGDFTVRTARLKSVLQFTPELSWDTTLQWDNQSDQAGLNSRVRYEFRPGQELYLVYNEGFDVIDNTLDSLGGELTLKAGLTFRF